MYGTSMSAERQENLDRLDAALLSLRRLVEVPGGRPALAHGGQAVEISTVLVTDAVARHRSEGRGDACSIGDVADALQVAHSTASRLVDRAAKAGMVARDRDPVDPRRTRLTLTAAGARLQQEAVRFRTGRLATALGDWSTEDVATLRGLLERFSRDTRHLAEPGRGRP